MRFQTLLADPPWSHKGPGWLGSAKRHYPVMQPHEIIHTTPVWDLAAESAHLWCWAIEEVVLSGVFAQVVGSWGFTPKARFPWTKLTRRPLSKKQVATYRETDQPIHEYQGRLYGRVWSNGYYRRIVTEDLILCVRGKDNLTNDAARQVRGEIIAPVGEHSEKPAESYALIESYSPGPPIELYARQRRTGWYAWGDGVPQGETGPDDPTVQYLPRGAMQVFDPPFEGAAVTTDRGATDGSE